MGCPCPAAWDGIHGGFAETSIEGLERALENTSSGAQFAREWGLGYSSRLRCIRNVIKVYTHQGLNTKNLRPAICNRRPRSTKMPRLQSSQNISQLRSRL